jgi:hypothetical protein
MAADGSDLLYRVACEECGKTPELLDEDLTCSPCRERIHTGVQS